MIEKIVIITFLLILTIHFAISMKEWMRIPFNLIKPEGFYNPIPELSDTFTDRYYYNDKDNPVEVFCMLTGANDFLERSVFTKHAEQYVFREGLIKQLRDGQRPLQVFIEGMGVDGIEYHDRNAVPLHVAHNIYKVREWGIKSKSNICCVTFAYKNKIKDFLDFSEDVRRIASSSRLEFVARIVYELVFQVYFDRIAAMWLEAVLFGFSFGGHMMARAARDLAARHKGKLHRIFALDPGNVELCIGPRIIQPSDAEIVQVLHTEPGRSGLLRKAGRQDIYVRHIPKNVSKHYVAPYIHAIISMRLCRLFAQKKSLGFGRRADEGEIPNEREVEVGAYSDDFTKTGRFELSFLIPCIIDNMKNVKIRTENYQQVAWYQFWRKRPFSKEKDNPPDLYMTGQVKPGSTMQSTLVGSTLNALAAPTVPAALMRKTPSADTTLGETPATPTAIEALVGSTLNTAAAIANPRANSGAPRIKAGDRSASTAGSTTSTTARPPPGASGSGSR